MNSWQGSESTYGGGVMASQPSTFQYHNASAMPAPVQAQGMQGQGTHGVQGLMQHSTGTLQEDGLSVLRQLVQGPDQAIWLQQELAKRPLRPGQSPLHWVIWREKCEEGYDQNTAWVMALEDERKATDAQAAQHSQQFQQPQQSAPTTINPAQIHAAAPYQGPSQSYGSYPQTGYVGYVGGPSEDPRQGGHAHMHDASPVQPMNHILAPQSVSYGPGSSDVTMGQPEASSSKQTLDVSAAPRDSVSDTTFANGSPLDTLASSFSPAPSFSTLYHPPRLHRVAHSKRPVMSLSVFDKLVPLPPNRITSAWSSSALDRKPTKAEREALAAKRAKAAAEEKPSNWATVQSLITPEALLMGKPLPVFKLLRMRRDAQDNVLAPVFVPNPAQTLEVLIQLKNHAPPIYLERVGQTEKYALVLRKWMMKATKEPKEWEKCMAPLFQVLAKTPVLVDTIFEYNFGKHAKALVDKAEKEGLGSLGDIVAAYKHYERFVMTLVKQDKEAKEREEAKRGAAQGEGSASRTEDGTAPKRQRAEDGSARPLAKSEPSESAKATSNKTSADMSFFGSTSSTGAGPSRPRPKLPDIKKRDPPVPSAIAAPVASPAAGLLAATMQALRQPSRPVTAALTASVPEIVEVKPTGPKPNKKGHIVRFRDAVEDGGELVSVREFKEEVWELERPPWQHDEDVAGKTAHQLDMGEGRALRIHEVMEAEIDWYDPHLYNGGTDPIDPTPEAVEQETRERGILSVVYNPGQVPPDPDESGVRVVQRGPGTGTWWPPSHDFAAPAPQTAPAPNPQAAASVSALLGSLKPTLFNAQTPTPPPAPGYAYGQPAGSYDYSYAGQAYQPPPQQPGYGGWNEPSAAGPSGVNGYRGYGYEQHNERRDNGYGARSRGGPPNRGGSSGGRGKNPSNIVCKHWLVNGCYKGDNCNFRHSRD